MGLSRKTFTLRHRDIIFGHPHTYQQQEAPISTKFWSSQFPNRLKVKQNRNSHPSPSWRGKRTSKIYIRNCVVNKTGVLNLNIYILDFVSCRIEIIESQLKKMPRISKPKGRMTPYACFVRRCRDEHYNKFPNVGFVFTEFSRQCAERWKVSNYKVVNM